MALTLSMFRNSGLLCLSSSWLWILSSLTFKFLHPAAWDPLHILFSSLWDSPPVLPMQSPSCTPLCWVAPSLSIHPLVPFFLPLTRTWYTPACLAPECQLREILTFILATTLPPVPSTLVECVVLMVTPESRRLPRGEWCLEPREGGVWQDKKAAQTNVGTRKLQPGSQSSVNKVLLVHKCTVIYALSTESSHHNSRVNHCHRDCMVYRGWKISIYPLQEMFVNFQWKINCSQIVNSQAKHSFLPPWCPQTFQEVWTPVWESIMKMKTGAGGGSLVSIPSSATQKQCDLTHLLNF